MAYIPKAKQKPWIKEKQKGFEKNNSNQFYHSTEWRKTRKIHLQIEPFCRICKKHGRVQEANMVDHIKRINPRDAYDTDNGHFGEPLDHDNMQSLCDHRSSYNCHARKRAKERHGKC